MHRGLMVLAAVLALGALVQPTARGGEAMLVSTQPFSFVYNGKSSRDILGGWTKDSTSRKLDRDRTQTVDTYLDLATGLKVTCESIQYTDFPAKEWLLWFENTGAKDTPIIENVWAMDCSPNDPMPGDSPYRLHKTHGGTPDPKHFEPSVVPISKDSPQSIAAASGRSSTQNFPFFKIDTGRGAIVTAIGWSGNWKCDLACPDNANLHITAGLEKTHFLLHPGEKIRSPRILLLDWKGDSQEANAQFRQLIYKHYAAKRAGKTPEPIPFCNTAFTRDGYWLNECNAENQISLIKAYAKLGLEALLTDAGWFTGGWPGGAGNWDVRKDAYPNGMAPVAAAAKDNNMVYGLWFEPERVVAGTTVHKQHPEWCLKSQKEGDGTFLLNFGLPEVQNYFFDIVKGFMDLPGFGFYRQDFNMDPLPYWRFNDAEDRQGITETKYVMGTYAYWDRILKTWPGALLEECASGGHRIDLETIMRLQIAQKTDLWFQDDIDQAALWGTSEYLPNNCIVAALNNLNEYSFHSTMASSLCLGWIADAPDFDFKLGRKYLDTYHDVRHLLVGGWYPLLPYTRSADRWMAVQYDRTDIGEGMILAFRHAQSPYKTIDVALHNLDPNAEYVVTSDGATPTNAKGSELMKSFEITLLNPRSSVLIRYKKTGP